MNKKYTFDFFTNTYDDIERKTRQLAHSISKVMASNNSDKANKLFDEIKPIRYTIQSYMEEFQQDKSLYTVEDKTQRVIQITYIIALIDTLQLYIEKLHVKEEIENVDKSINVNDLLRLFIDKSTYTEIEFRDATNFTFEQIHNVINELNKSQDVKLINVEKFSNFEIYSLTPIGRKYIESIIEEGD